MPVRGQFAAEAFRLGRVMQQWGEVAIVEAIRELKYGRSQLAGYYVRGGAGDPNLLHPTLVAAEAEFLRRNWHLLIRKR
jgi:hypothetical protein